MRELLRRKTLARIRDTIKDHPVGTQTGDADGPIRIVTLNRPDQANAVNKEMHSAFARVWPTLSEDEDARAVVLTGAGRAFSAGGDLVQWLENYVENPVTRRAGMREARRIVREMIEFPLPIIAAVNGPVVGFGCSIAVLCDITVQDGGLLVNVEMRPEMLAQLREQLGDEPEDQDPIPLGLLSGDGDRYLVTGGPARGLKGYFVRGASGEIEGVHLGGRLATRTGAAPQVPVTT